MVVDIQQSLLTSIYNVLVEDSNLETAMGGTVRVYPVDAPPDAEFPYIVHRIDMNIGGDWNPQDRDTYILDIYSDSPNDEEILEIRRLIMGLIDGLDSSTDETTEYYVWRQTDGFVPETRSDIWHYACQFNLKWLNDAQIGVQLKR